MKNLQKLMISLGLDLSEWRDGISRAKREFASLRNDISQSLGKIGVGFAMIAGSFLGLFGAGEVMAQQSRAFEVLQEKVGAADQQMVALKDDVYELNNALGLRSVSTAAHKFAQVAKMSKTTGEELKRLTWQTGLLGKMFGEEESQLTAQVAMMKAFKTSAAEVGDVVAYLNKQGGDIKGELLESIREYSVQFAEAGFSLDQTVSMLKAGLSEGWNVDKAADAIKEGRIRLMGGEKTAIDALAVLGLSDLDEQIKQGVLSIPDAMALIQSELSKITPSEQMRVAKEIFGAPYEDVGAEAMTAMLEGMRKEVHYSGAIDQLAESLNNRFSHKWDQGISNLTNSFSKMLEALKPHVLPLVEAFTELTDDISAFAGKYEYITKTIGASVGVFLGLAAVLGSLSVIAGLAGIAFAVLTSPITLIVAGVVAIGAGLLYLEHKTGLVSDIFKKWLEIVSNYFNRIGDTIESVKDLFENGFSIDGLFKVMENAARVLLSPFDTIFDTDLTRLFKETISGWGDDLLNTLMRPINSIRNSRIGQFMGWADDESGSSAQSIREGGSRDAPSTYQVSDSRLAAKHGQTDKDSQQSGQPVYQWNIRHYHSNSRNAAADFETLAVTAP